MKFQKINIATARIKGLKEPSYYCVQRHSYAWDIIFEDASTLLLKNLPFIKVGNTEKEGEFFAVSLKKISLKRIFVMAIKFLLFSRITVVFWQSATQEKMCGLIQLTNLSKKLL